MISTGFVEQRTIIRARRTKEYNASLFGLLCFRRSDRFVGSEHLEEMPLFAPLEL